MVVLSLNEIKGKIQLHPEVWVHMHTTNCYAYALGLDISENKICLNAYQPGIMSKVVDSLSDFSYDLLLRGIESDFDRLDIKHREVLPDEKISDDEWKIALLTEKIDGKLTDFHFLRQFSDGKWFHKYGYYGKICDRDCLDRVILNPVDSEWDSFRYDKCYALRINR